MAGTRVVEIPYAPRNWAKPLHASLKRWAVLVLHRRAGKTTAILNHHQRAALDDAWEARRLRYLLPGAGEADIRRLLRRRVYWHVMPSYHQCKVTGAWDILKEIARPVPGAKPNESELKLDYPNGNRVQLVGADDPDRLRGPGLSGLSLDEFPQIRKEAFSEVLSKALADHLGWCIFSGTIKGQDQLYSTYEAAKDDPEWLALWQNIDQSLETETGATIEALRRAMEDDRKLVAQGLMSQAEYDQEWYLSPEAAIKGAFYGDQMKALRERGQITRVPYDPAIPVDTDWDLGIDAMAIWFSQSLRSGEVRVIDYHEDIGGGLEACIKAVRGQAPDPSNDDKIAAANDRRSRYTYGNHWAPHDIEVREISSGLTRRQIARNLGLSFEVTPRLGVDEGISAVQMFLPKCWFDETAAKGGIEAMRQYRRTYNARLDQYTAKPVHDWASHAADAFRGLAVRYKLPAESGHKTRVFVPAATAWT